MYECVNCYIIATDCAAERLLTYDLDVEVTQRDLPQLAELLQPYI